MRIIIVVWGVWVSLVSHAYEGGSSCDLPEIIKYQSNQYNHLVCKANDFHKQGRFSEAILTLENALDEEIFEEPNVLLFSRLALLHAEYGDKKKSKTYLLKAKLSLEILYGISRCDLDYEFTENIQMDNLYDQEVIGILRGKKRIESSVAKEIFFRMCQENMVDFYQQNFDLNGLLDDPLVTLYLKARETVLSK
ncbi:hypothetical protein [Catenovulum sediminis]|uniref:Tetratricopeptide repeat protein n=1 Tax=Catenovulum sediminis TaxID=1740262 RepID=A0ABV1RN66_9ALTE